MTWKKRWKGGVQGFRTPAVYLLEVCRWVVSRLLRRPISWFWLLACLTLWPAVVVFSPGAIALEAEDASRLAYEISFLACLGGSSLALSTLGENRWILDQAGRSRRLSARAAGLLVGGAAAAGVSLVFPLLLGGPLSFEWGAIGLALTLTIGHVTGLGLLLLKVPMPASARSLLLPVFAWILPSCIDPDDRFLGTFVTLFRADRDLEWIRESNPTGPVTIVAPMVALWVAAILLEGCCRSEPAPMA